MLCGEHGVCPDMFEAFFLGFVSDVAVDDDDYRLIPKLEGYFASVDECEYAALAYVCRNPATFIIRAEYVFGAFRA